MPTLLYLLLSVSLFFLFRLSPFSLLLSLKFQPVNPVIFNMHQEQICSAMNIYFSSWAKRSLEVPSLLHSMSIQSIDVAKRVWFWRNEV